MAVNAMVLPILLGKIEEWRQYNREVSGPRRSEFQDMWRRHGITKHLVWRQQTPQGDFLIVYQEMEDRERALRGIATSDHPFDRWFKEQVKGFTGVDLNQGPPGAPPELVMEYVG